MCKAFGIQATQTFFSSDYLNHIADKVGFKIDSQYTMQEMNKIYPKIPFNEFDTTIFAMKSWDFQS